MIAALKPVLAAATGLLILSTGAHGAEQRVKADSPLLKLTRSPDKKASSVARTPSSAAQPALPSFVIPRDTCQQGEPLQTLPLAKP